jgi:hypothetical protein
LQLAEYLLGMTGLEMSTWIMKSISFPSLSLVVLGFQTSDHPSHRET